MKCIKINNKFKKVYYVQGEKEEPCYGLTKKYDWNIKSKTMLTNFIYGQRIKSITKNILRERQRSENIIEVNYEI